MRLHDILRKVVHLLNLESEVDDYERIHETIVRDSEIRGTNLWILIFAIVVASVGLNMNSTAVIIGAMLISPLMGPINGMGYSIATYDFPLFRRAVRNYTFAVGASLVASTTYFAVSPISTAHSEILARTSPTIYDVLIALFGGLAGIVAISSRQKGNVIPGVAIATALMPPLCTAGYGLATAQFDFFFGALYLFSINTVFIALSSVAVSQLLEYPIRTIVEDGQRKRVNRWISAVILLMLLPSVYFGYRLVQREKFTVNAGRFIDRVGLVGGSVLMKSDVEPVARTITLTYGGEGLDDGAKASVRGTAADFSLGDATILFREGVVSERTEGSGGEADRLKAEVNRLTLLLRERDRRADSLAATRLRGKRILAEINALYPSIVGCSYSEALFIRGSSSVADTAVVVIFETRGQSLPKNEREKIVQWLRASVGRDSVRVFFDR